MSKLTITKTTTKRYNIQQIALDMMCFDESYRRIRGNMRNKLFSCHSCGRNFQDGEKMSLIITDKGNKMVCHKCGEEIKAELGEEFN